MFDVSMQFSHIQFVQHIKLNEDDDLFVVCRKHSILQDLKITVRQFQFKSRGKNTIQNTLQFLLRYNDRKLIKDCFFFFILPAFHCPVQDLRLEKNMTN